MGSTQYYVVDIGMFLRGIFSLLKGFQICRNFADLQIVEPEKSWKCVFGTWNTLRAPLLEKQVNFGIGNVTYTKIK